MLIFPKKKYILFFILPFFLGMFFLFCPLDLTHAAGDTTTRGGSGSVAAPAPPNGWFVTSINEILSAIISLIGTLITAAAILLGWVIDVNNYKLLKSSAVENSWKVIRDILNLAFILVLLFSAFATIFQIEKYHLKKILLTLVIMALLINFSLPISRFVIDTANIPMYYIATIIFEGGSGSVSTAIGKGSTIGSMFQPMIGTSYGSPMQYLAAIIFSFIFLITLFALAFMFLIRLVVLILLCIFSPLGFVAAILPSTQNYANDYWHTLFKNAFFGPIMLLMLAISIYVLKAFQTDSLLSLAQTNSTNPDNADTLALWAFYFVPIVMLWGGMIWSQKLGAVGASVVMNKANSFARKPFDKTWGWTVGGGKAIAGGVGALASNGISRIPYLRGLQAFPSAAKKAWYTNPAERAKKRREDYNEIAAARLTRGDSAKNARRRIEDKRITEQSSEWEKVGVGNSFLKEKMKSTNAREAKAAVELLTKRKDLDNPNDLVQALKVTNDDGDRMKKVIESAPKEALKSLDETALADINNAITSADAKKRRLEFNPNLNSTEIDAQTKKLSESLNKKLKDEGLIHKVIEMEIKTKIADEEARLGRPLTSADKNSIQIDAYSPTNKDSRLFGQGLSDIAKLDKDVFAQQGLRDYLNTISSDPNQKRAYQNFYANLGSDKKGPGLAPPPR